MDNIFLIGMMGSGKTTTARELSKLCRRSVIDLDVAIEESSKKTINQIFSESGESAFRDLEKKALLKAIASKECIVATGGGIVLLPENVDQMRSSGRIVYLETSFPVLWSRVKNSKARPLLKSESPEQALRALFDKRVPLYESAASIAVITDGKTPKQVAEELYPVLFNEKN